MRGPFEFRRQLCQDKSWDIYLLYSKNRIILFAVILSQYPRASDDDRREITYHDNSRTLQCKYNVWLKMGRDKGTVNNFYSRQTVASSFLWRKLVQRKALWDTSTSFGVVIKWMYMKLCQDSAPHSHTHL